MTTLATLVVRITADTTDYQTKLKAVSEMGKKISDVGGKLTKAVTLPLVAIGAASVYAAANLADMRGKVETIFSESSKMVEDFGRTAATNFGLSNRAADEATSTFGAMFTNLGLGTGAAAKMSIGMVGLASDMAEFRNEDPSAMLDSLQGALTGRGMDLKKFGLDLSDATVQAKALEMGIGGVGGKMSEAQAVQVRYALIMEQTSKIQGTFAASTGDLGPKLVVMKAKLENAAAALGEKLLPYALKAVDFITRLITAFTNLPAPVQNTVITVAALAAATGPVLTIFGKLMTVGSGVAGSLMKIVPAITANIAVLGPLAIAIGAVVAVGMAYNNLNKQTEAGVKQVQTAWGNYFNQQISQGKTATEIADAYNKKTVEVDKTFNDQKDVLGKVAVAWIKLSQDESKFLGDQAGLKQALLQTATSAEDYYQAVVRAAGGTTFLTEASTPLGQAIKAKAEAEWNAVHATEAVTIAEGALAAVGIPLADSMSIVASALSDVYPNAADATEQLNKLKIALGLLTPEQAQVNSDTELMAKAWGVGAVEIDRLTGFMKNAAATGMSDMTNAERKLLTSMTAVNEEIKETINLTDTYGMLTQAATDLGMADEELNNLQLIMMETVGGLSDELNTTSTDMQLLAQATAMGLYSTTQYGLAMHDAAAGTFELAGAERASIQASVEAAKAQRDKALAVQAAGQSYLELSASLKGATNAQIAQTAIAGLSQMQQEGKIDFSTYFSAVSGVQETFGLADEKSRALAGALPLLNDALAAGVLPASQYDDALKAVITDSGDGVINMDNIINKFGVMPESVEAAIGSFGLFGETLTTVPLTAATSAQQTYDAFDTKNWETIGTDAAHKIGDGITTSTPYIVAAAQAVVQAAINAANAAGVAGPTATPTTTTPPPPAPGYAEGGSGLVPQGYPNDSYLIGLTSGENFTVTPPGGWSGETIINVPIVIYGNADPKEVQRAARDGVLSAQRAAGKR